MSTGLALLSTLLYLLPLALIAWLLSERTRYPRWLLVGVLVSLPVFYIGHYLLIGALQGWPSTAGIPARFDLIAHEVTEPDIKAGKPGEILLWLRGSDETRPRIHSLPYDKTLHGKLVAAEERQVQGHTQQGHRRTTRPSEGGPGTHGDDIIDFEDAPRATLPDKPATP